MGIITSKTLAVVLNWNKVACYLHVSGETLSQVEESKNVKVLFRNETKIEPAIGNRIRVASRVMWSLYQSVVSKKELS